MGHTPPAADIQGFVFNKEDIILFHNDLTSIQNQKIFNNLIQKMDEDSGCVSHQPWPVDDPVQPQCNEDELQNVH